MSEEALNALVRRANPVSRDRVAGWSTSPRGRLAQARALGGAAGSSRPGLAARSRPAAVLLASAAFVAAGVVAVLAAVAETRDVATVTAAVPAPAASPAPVAGSPLELWPGPMVGIEAPWRADPKMLGTRFAEEVLRWQDPTVNVTMPADGPPGEAVISDNRGHEITLVVSPDRQGRNWGILSVGDARFLLANGDLYHGGIVPGGAAIVGLPVEGAATSLSVLLRTAEGDAWRDVPRDQGAPDTVELPGVDMSAIHAVLIVYRDAFGQAISAAGAVMKDSTVMGSPPAPAP